MSLTRFRSWMFLGLSLLSGSTPLMAQHGGAVHTRGDHLPFHPVDVASEHNYRPFEAADLSTYGNGPQANEGFWFQYDRVAWAMPSPKRIDIGDPASQGGGLFINGQFLQNANSLDTSFMETEWTWGNRYELGYMNNNRGWMVSTAHVHEYHQSVAATNVSVSFFDPLTILTSFVDLDQDGTVDDINGNAIFGNNAPFNFDQGTPTGGVPPFILPPDGILDTNVGPDFGDVVTIPVLFDTMFVRNATRFHTLELMHVTRWDPLHYGGTFEWLGGLRYINLTDEFTGIADGTGINGTVYASLDWNSRINNHIIGPQIGMKWYRTEGRWRINTEARFTAAANFQQVRLNGGFVSNNLGLGTNTDFDSSINDTTFAPVGEIRLDTSFQLTKAISLRMGYTGTVIGGISRASRRIDWTLPALTIREDNRIESFFINGFNFGFEVNR